MLIFRHLHVRREVEEVRLLVKVRAVHADAVAAAAVMSAVEQPLVQVGLTAATAALEVGRGKGRGAGTGWAGEAASCGGR